MNPERQRRFALRLQAPTVKACERTPDALSGVYLHLAVMADKLLCFKRFMASTAR